MTLYINPEENDSIAHAQEQARLALESAGIPFKTEDVTRCWPLSSRPLLPALDLENGKQIGRWIFGSQSIQQYAQNPT